MDPSNPLALTGMLLLLARPRTRTYKTIKCARTRTTKHCTLHIASSRRADVSAIFSRLRQRLLGHVRLAMRAGMVVIAASAHRKRGIREGLAIQAICHAILNHARQVRALAARRRSCAVRVLTARQDGALHVAQVEEELLVLQTSSWLVGATLSSLLRARDAKTAAPAQVVLAARRECERIRARGLLAASPRRLPEVILPTRQTGALGVAEACMQLLVIGAWIAIVEVLLGCHCLHVGMSELRRRDRCRLIHSHLTGVGEADRL